MKQYLQQKIDAWREHGEQFDCTHESTSLRRRVIKGGAIQYVHQCLRCGESRNQPLAKLKAIETNGGSEPPPFDDALREAWEERRSASAEFINKRFSRDAFFADYDQYLKSDAWLKRRSLVLKRVRNICEGCGEAQAIEVHHLTYAHVGREFLFELVALCGPCHDRLHEDDDDSNS